MLPEFLQNHPLWLVFTAMTVIAMARGQATYWIARAVTEQALGPQSGRPARSMPARHARLAAWLRGRDVSRGAQALRTWGLIAIPLGYLTVGLQTLVLAAAGVLRIPWMRFTLVQVPGALAWAAIYSTIGWAVWEAGIAAVTGHPAALIGLVALLTVALATVVVNRRCAPRTPPAAASADRLAVALSDPADQVGSGEAPPPVR